MHNFKQGFCILRATDVIQDLTEEHNLEFTKIWLYPAKGAVNGKLTANTNDIFIGKRGVGDRMTPDTIAAVDPPFTIEILAGQPPMKLRDVIVQGLVGDGFFYSFT